MQRLGTADTDILDLGALSPPLLFFGGPYSNLHATKALIQIANDLGIPPSSCICTGDVVAYGAHPQETTDAVRSFWCSVVRGNCEDAFGAQTGDCGCGFEAGSRCDVLSVQWMDFAQRNMNDAACTWMADLPSGIRFSVDDTRFFVTHGAPSQVNKFIFGSTDAAIKDAEIAATATDVMIAGHCGLPFSVRRGSHLWHNPGVIGLPANDGTPRTWFSVLRREAAGLWFDTRPLTYDYGAAQNAMRTVGLPEAYAATLSTGLWDNCDVLPATETAAQGVPLAPADVLIPRAETGLGPSSWVT